MAMIYLLSALALGAALVRRVPFELYRFEAAAMAVSVGLFTWTWLTFLACLVMPFDTALPIVVTVSAVATVALWWGRAPVLAPSPSTRISDDEDGVAGHAAADDRDVVAERAAVDGEDVVVEHAAGAESDPVDQSDTAVASRWRPLEGGRTAWIVWGVATAVIVAVLGRLLWMGSLREDATGIWSSGAMWADYGLHSTIITHIAAGTSLPSDFPVASGEKLTYPFLIDFLSAIYLYGGMSLHASLFIPGLLLSLAICQLLISVGLRLFGRISVGVGGLALALLSGSAAGTWVAWSDWRESGKGLFAFLGDMKLSAYDYTSVDGPNAHVTNLVVDAILPQRSFLFGLGVGLVALIFMHTAREKDNTKLLWPAAVIVGLLPMAHAHSFIVGTGLLAWLAADAAWRTRKVPLAYLAPLGLTLLLALPQLLWQQTANGRGTGGHFKFAWMWQSGQSVPGYWWANFGIVGILILAAPFILRRHRQTFWLLPMLVVFAVTQLYAFQPTEYDNLKLIYWVYIVGGFFIAYLVSELVRRHRAWLALVIPVALFVVTPGALAITREFQLKYQFATPDDIQVADWAGKNTAPDAVFAAYDRTNVPVATLAGRILMSGYSGWLYNFSIPYEPRQAAVRAAFMGDFANPELVKYSPDYLLVTVNPDPNFPVNEAALATRPVLFSNATWKVYAAK